MASIADMALPFVASLGTSRKNNRGGAEGSAEEIPENSEVFVTKISPFEEIFFRD